MTEKLEEDTYNSFAWVWLNITLSDFVLLNILPFLDKYMGNVAY